MLTKLLCDVDHANWQVFINLIIYISGKSPEMVFYNENGEELERIDITKMTRNELNALITAKGIPVKSGKHDEV